MKAHFINVGQADATLLEFPCGAILIDAGAQDRGSADHLIQYLKRFFARRTDLNNTLDLVIISHNHLDHDTVLLDVANNFHIKNFVDNGVKNGSGNVNQSWMENHARESGINYVNYSFDQIAALNDHKGITNTIIDPVNCSVVNPIITVLSGRFQNLPTGWTTKEIHSKGNYHSLIIKVTYGKSSFLFTGDLELKAIKQVLNYYGNSGALDVDVWKVSHHGSDNGTTKQLLNAITPKYAVICCGQWFEGDHSKSHFNTYHYGHPRVSTLNLLSESIPENRPPLDTPIVAFNGIKEKHIKMTITKNIYCTAWDGDITIKATSAGTYMVVTKDR